MFKAINKPPKIKYIEMPNEIKNQYQYYTEAEMVKLKNMGYNKSFTSLEDGVKDYVNNYLLTNDIYK